MAMASMGWVGLVWAIFCGWAASSYCSNFIFRLPRKEYPFGRKPYCDACNALLQPKDLFPIFSFLLTDGKCRYCGSSVPLAYYLVELIYPLVFIALYFSYGFGDMFLLAALGFTALLVLAMMAYDSGYYSPMTLLFIAVLGVILQTMNGTALTEITIGALSCFIAAVFVHRIRTKAKEEIDLRTLPPYVWMMTAMGCWLTIPDALICAALWLSLKTLLGWIWQPKHPLALVTLCFAVSLSAIVLYRY